MLDKDKANNPFPNYYEKRFEDPLDMATWLLRDELRKLAGYEESDIPSKHMEIAKRLVQKENELA